MTITYVRIRSPLVWNLVLRFLPPSQFVEGGHAKSRFLSLIHSTACNRPPAIFHVVVVVLYNSVLATRFRIIDDCVTLGLVVANKNMPRGKRSADGNDDAFDSRIRRRSGRTPKPRDHYLKEVLTKGGILEWTTEECCGLHQPGEHIVTEEERRAKEQGKQLFQRHLKPAGWTWKQRSGLTYNWIMIAPGIPREKEERGTNMFVSFQDIFDQYEEDGQTTKEILARAGRNRTSRSDGSTAPALRGTTNAATATAVAVESKKEAPNTNTAAAGSATMSPTEPRRLNRSGRDLTLEIGPTVEARTAAATAVKWEEHDSSHHQNNSTANTAIVAVTVEREQENPIINTFASISTNVNPTDPQPDTSRTVEAPTSAAVTLEWQKMAPTIIKTILLIKLHPPLPEPLRKKNHPRKNNPKRPLFVVQVKLALQIPMMMILKNNNSAFNNCVIGS
jgi:hypothetical protein